MADPIDPTDWKILRFLQQHPDASNQQLAEAVSLSPSPCWRRVQRLRERGVIIGQRVELDAARLGLDFTVYAFIKLNRPNADKMLAFEQLLDGLDEVVSCERITGNIDYLIKVVTLDMHAYDALLRDHLLQWGEIGELESHIVVSTAKDSRCLPLDRAQRG